MVSAPRGNRCLSAVVADCTPKTPVRHAITVEGLAMSVGVNACRQTDNRGRDPGSAIGRPRNMSIDFSVSLVVARLSASETHKTRAATHHPTRMKYIRPGLT
jgi:hypothetical protein